jgi:hypothetical protein
MPSQPKNRLLAKKGDKEQKRVQSADELINRLTHDIASDSCVLFVGAGSTTEKWRQSPNFFSKIRVQTSAKKSSDIQTFPDLMQLFCDERDGGHHNLLIREAINYLEPFLLRGPANRVATEFSRSLAAIPFFKTIVTTNWDPLLERALDVLVPITEDRDLAFWDDQKKQVLKLHGCITRPHSIVATRSDYEACVNANALVFNKLRDLMATKTFLFTGYSLEDADFREVWESITGRLGQFSKLAFALDPNASDENVNYWERQGILIFRIDDVQFLHKLRKHLVKKGLIPSELLMSFLMRERRRIVQLHLRNNQNSDGALSSAMYQDGLIHELDDILDSVQLGTKKHEDFENELGYTLNKLKMMQKRKNPIEIAYWSGRYIAIDAYFEADRKQIPPYFHPYRLEPLNKLVKGRIWNSSSRRPAKSSRKSRLTQDISTVSLVCNECAKKLHQR